MDKVRHILVSDCANNVPSNIGFLLKLAGYRVSIFNDELEACNWLLQKDQTLAPAHMLLLTDPETSNPLFSLLFQIRQKFAQLEILLVTTQPLQLTGQILELDPQVHQCLPGEIHHMTRQIFSGAEAALNRQRPHQPSSPNLDSGREEHSLHKAEQEK